MRNRTSPIASRGLTLLELMLSMALTAVILVAIGMAIDLHLRMVDSRRSSVEKSQMARAVLSQIADDLAEYDPAEFRDISDHSGSEELAGDTMCPRTARWATRPGSWAWVNPVCPIRPVISPVHDSLPAVAGLYGNQYELQVDVSRLPRVDEFQRLVSPDAALHDRGHSKRYQDSRLLCSRWVRHHGQLAIVIQQRTAEPAGWSGAADFGPGRHFVRQRKCESGRACKRSVKSSHRRSRRSSSSISMDWSGFWNGTWRAGRVARGGENHADDQRLEWRRWPYRGRSLQFDDHASNWRRGLFTGGTSADR